MKTFPKKIFASALLSVVALAPFAFADIETLLPASKTVAFAKIENFSELKKKLKTDELAVDFHTKFFSKIKKNLLAKTEDDSAEKAKNACDWIDAVSGSFNGEIVLACVTPHGDVAALLIADCADNFDFEKTTKLLIDADGSADVKFSDEQISGVPVKVCKSVSQKQPTAFAATIDGKYFLTDNKAALKNAIKAAKKTDAKTPAGMFASKAFKNARARVNGSDFWYYIDGETLAETAYKAAAEADKKAAESARASGEISLSAMLQFSQIVRALAPEAIVSVYGFGTIDAAKNYPAETVITWKQKRGIVAALLTNAIKSDFEKPAVFPSRADVVGVSAGSYSFGKAVQGLLNIAREASPMAALSLDFLMQNLKINNGIDIPAWLAALGHGSYSYAWGGKRIWAANVSSDAFVLSAAREACNAKDAYVVEKKLPDGKPFFEIPKSEIAFVARDGKLFVAKTDALFEFLKNSSAQPAPISIWNDKTFASLEALLPPGGSSVDLMHVGRALRAARGGSLPAGENDLGYEEYLPSIGENDFDYWSVTKSYLVGNEFTVKTRTVKNK